MIDRQVLKFGDFVTKSGRKTPFFVNTGYYRTGSQLKRLGEYYAQAIMEAFGGEFNYSKRPVVIAVGGRLIAASLQGFPHGEDTVAANEMAGHACMFFDGSLSHVGQLPDVEHATQVNKAAGR